MNSEVSGSSRSGITGMTLHERTAASKDTRSVLGRWNCPLKDRRKINHSKLSSRPGQKKKSCESGTEKTWNREEVLRWQKNLQRVHRHAGMICRFLEIPVLWHSCSLSIICKINCPALDTEGRLQRPSTVLRHPRVLPRSRVAPSRINIQGLRK